MLTTPIAGKKEMKMKKQQKLRIGKRYWLDSQKDISGLFVGYTVNGSALFRALTDNYIYLTDEDGNVPMPGKNVTYERRDDLVVFV